MDINKTICRFTTTMPLQESGNISSHEDYKGSERKALNGHLLAYIQTNGTPGIITVTISSPGLKAASLTLNVK